MGNQIFLSHSKRDIELVNPIAQVFASTNLKLVMENFEGVANPPASEIQEDIEDSKALFVLLGPNTLYHEHTQNWIAWECGVAAQAGLPIWVFEDTNNPVDFPIPQLTNYLIFDSKDMSDLQAIRSIVIEEFEVSNVPLAGVLVGGVLGEAIAPGGGWKVGSLLGAIFDTKEKNILGYDIICQHCNQNFFLHSDVDTLKCPSCRKIIF